jgi:hypothetical protein
LQNESIARCKHHYLIFLCYAPAYIGTIGMPVYRLSTEVEYRSVALNFTYRYIDDVLSINSSRFEIRIIATGPCKTNQLRDVNTICRRSWYIAAHIWKIYDFKIKVVRFIIHFSTMDFHIVKMYKDKDVNKDVKNMFLSMCDVRVLLTFTSLNLVLLWQLFYLFCSNIVINTVNKANLFLALVQQPVSQIKMTFQEIRIIASVPCKTNQLRDVNTICRRFALFDLLKG